MSKVRTHEFNLYVGFELLLAWLMLLATCLVVYGMVTYPDFKFRLVMLAALSFTLSLFVGALCAAWKCSKCDPYIVVED